MLTKTDKQTLRIHLIYSVIEGMLKGLLILNEFIFLKSILGSNYQLGFLFQFGMLVLLFSVFFNEWMNRIRRKRKFLLYVALVSRLPLISLFFFPNTAEMYEQTSLYHFWFLSVFFMFYISMPIILPTLNQILRNVYTEGRFGKLYSIGQQVEKVSILLSTFIFGIWLDFNPFAFRLFYPVMAILGVGSIFLLGKIPYQPIDPGIRERFLDSVKTTFTRMLSTLKNNRPFLHYQISFMFYGYAFMSTSAVITIFYKEELGLNYSSLALYKNLFNILAIGLFPLFGRMIDKIDPRRFIIFTYSSLALYLFFIMFSQYFDAYIDLWNFRIYYSLLIAIFFMGIFTATMSLSWNIGSSYFGKASEAGNYQSIHLTLTGLRAIFAPILGVYFLERFNYSTAFIIAIFSLIGAIFIVIASLKRIKIHVS